MNLAQEKAKNGEHETHTTALVAIALLAGVICFLAYSWSGAIAEQMRLVDYTTPDIQAQQPAKMAAASADLELPDGMPVDGSQITKDETVQIDGKPARVIAFESSQSMPDLHGSISGWLTGHNFELMKQREGNLAASLAAVNGNKNIIVLISYLDQSNLSRVEIINSVNNVSS